MKTLPEKLSALDVMSDAPVIPVIVLNKIEHAVPLAKALVAGGIRMLEITLRTPVALQGMEVISKEVPQAVVGAGTVRNAKDAQAAMKAGARFAVSPGFTSQIGQVCKDSALPLLPGVATGSEIMQACEAGYSELKFFPAVQAGGAAMLKAWSGPFADIKFCPTGGVSAANAREFLNLANVVCVGGSWLTPQDLMERNQWEQITALAKEACALKTQV